MDVHFLGVAMSIESDAYAKHMNLKLAANELGVNWKTLYCRLKKQGVKVAGDKLRYGADRDKLGALGESIFKKYVPDAVDKNKTEFQSKYDFDIYGLKIDVKCGKPRQLNKKYTALSWSFSFKKQSLIADFIVCFCLDDQNQIEKTLLVPNEFFKGLQTVSVSKDGGSKWLDYATSPEELQDFFKEVSS
jgi:hypothetical protein